MKRREYPACLAINGRTITKVIIDPHYEARHKDSITDEIILSLVQTLDGAEELPLDKDKEGFEYYVKDGIELNEKTYKLIWLLHDQEVFVGIINAYRRD